MFSKAENGCLYLHDLYGRVRQVVGDGMTWIYRYEADGRATVTTHPASAAAPCSSPGWDTRPRSVATYTFDTPNPTSD